MAESIGRCECDAAERLPEKQRDHGHASCNPRCAQYVSGVEVREYRWTMKQLVNSD